MNTKEIREIKEKLAVLNVTALTGVVHEPDVLYLRFEDYGLYIYCYFRFSNGNELILAQKDMYRPSLALLAQKDFDWDDFDSSIAGDNRMDEVIQEQFSSLDGFTVKKIKIKKTGDLMITFTNRYQLDLRIDLTEPVTCWRFFERDSDVDLLTVNGNGLEE